ARALDLRRADLRGLVDDLALEVTERHRVVVDDAERADAGCREIQRYRRAKAAGADDQHARSLQFLLALPADVLEDEVALVAGDLFGCESHARIYSPPEPPRPADPIGLLFGLPCRMLAPGNARNKNGARTWPHQQGRRHRPATISV